MLNTCRHSYMTTATKESNKVGNPCMICQNVNGSKTGKNSDVYRAQAHAKENWMMVCCDVVFSFSPPRCGQPPRGGYHTDQTDRNVHLCSNYVGFGCKWLFWCLKRGLLFPSPLSWHLYSLPHGLLYGIMVLRQNTNFSLCYCRFFLSGVSHPLAECLPYRWTLWVRQGREKNRCTCQTRNLRVMHCFIRDVTTEKLIVFSHTFMHCICPGYYYVTFEHQKH